MGIHRRKSKLKWVVRLHFWITFFSFVLYLGLGLALGPEFLYQDIRKKFFAFAADTVNVTAVVPGPPMAPVVTATRSCVDLAPQITLNWADDSSGTTTWDVERDSLPLTTGLVISGYTDTAVSASTTYSYQVIAHGPMSPGIATSMAVTATAQDCSGVTPVTITLETIGGRNVSDRTERVELTKKRPKVTGTSSIPYAIIDIEVTNPTLRARITANVNGYFEWIPPMSLDTGNHIITITATDPADTTRTGTDSLIFRTKHSGGPAAAEEKEEGPSGTEPEAVQPELEMVDFSVSVKNSEQTVFQGEELSVEVATTSGVFPEGAIGEILLSDGSLRNIFEFPGHLELGGLVSVTAGAVLPIYLAPGEYRVRTDITLGDETTSREAALTLRGRPLLVIGGHEVTYTEAASLIGTIFFLLLFALLFFLLSLVREYWLYLHSLRAITGWHLARLGLLGSRKGVIR